MIAHLWAEELTGTHPLTGSYNDRWLKRGF
jgi:hypothetical protein